MMNVVVMMMVMVVMMVMHRLGRHRRRAGWAAGYCFLGEGVAGKAERKHSRGGKGLDHGKRFLCLGSNPTGHDEFISDGR
jgi:hypothetical protein